MRQSILRQGDLVKYHNENSALTNMGFVLGQFYMVTVSEYDCLIVKAKCGISANLVRPNNDLTDAADHFAKVQCPLVLPRGVSQ